MEANEFVAQVARLPIEGQEFDREEHPTQTGEDGYVWENDDAFETLQSLIGQAREIQAKQRLEYLRGEIQAERISYGEIAELESLAEFIEDGDDELLLWAGTPENGAWER